MNKRIYAGMDGSTYYYNDRGTRVEVERATWKKTSSYATLRTKQATTKPKKSALLKDLEPRQNRRRLLITC